jgi:hypothetical protein
LGCPRRVSAVSRSLPGQSAHGAGRLCMLHRRFDRRDLSPTPGFVIDPGLAPPFATETFGTSRAAGIS